MIKIIIPTPILRGTQAKLIHYPTPFYQSYTWVERCSEPRESFGSMGKQHHSTKAMKATLVPISRMKSSMDWEKRKSVKVTLNNIFFSKLYFAHF